jgi:DNA-directed RNA polymerase subunit RPC12/RpoP
MPLVTFDCPSCSAPVKAPDDTRVVHCDYCGNNLMVPEHLRAAPQPGPFHDPFVREYNEFGTTIVINGGSSARNVTIKPDAKTARKIRRGIGCGSVLVVLFVIVTIIAPIGFAAYSIIESVKPGFFAEVTGSSYASKELSFGGRGRGAGLFENPTDLTTDKAGDVYVLESGSGRVQRFDAEGSYLYAWVVEGTTNASAITADKETNEVYVVADPKIYRFDGPSGSLLGMTLEDGSGFFATRDAALFPNGDLFTFVSGDTEDMVRIDPDGKEVARHAGRIREVYGDRIVAPAPWLVRLATDSNDRMYVLNKGVTGHAEVLIFEADGRYSTRFGHSGGIFTFARDIAVDSKGRIYLSDIHGIEVFDEKGKSLGTISLDLGKTVQAIEVSAKDELYVLTHDEVVKYVPR